MATFQIGETVICSCEVRDDAGVLKNPATSMTVAIYDANGVVVVPTTSMGTPDSTGKYHYDFASTGKPGLTYTVYYTATDGSRITIAKDEFKLES